MIKNIGVFCASGNQINHQYFDEAVVLGDWIGKTGRTLVYGGANVGLMEETAQHVKKHEGKIIGIITYKICTLGKKSSLPDQQIVVNDLNERKQKMIDLADIFIALPGGFGTLDEIFTVIASAQLEYHQKHVIFCNTNGLYNNLLNQIEIFYKQRFASEKYLNNYTVAKNISECITIIENIESKQ